MFYTIMPILFISRTTFLPNLNDPVKVMWEKLTTYLTETLNGTVPKGRVHLVLNGLMVLTSSLSNIGELNGPSPPDFIGWALCPRRIAEVCEGHVPNFSLLQYCFYWNIFICGRTSRNSRPNSLTESVFHNQFYFILIITYQRVRLHHYDVIMIWYQTSYDVIT